MIVSGTGSRSFITNNTINNEIAHFISDIEANLPIDEHLVLMSGLAEGWDEFLAWTAIHLSIPFIAAIPNKTYIDYYWGQHSVSGINRLFAANQLLQAAQEVIYVCDSIYVDGVHSNLVRNQYMVDHADHFLVWNEASRGKEDCLRRIKAANKPYTTIGGQA